MTEPLVDDQPTTYSLKAVLDHSPEIVASAIASLVNLVALVLALAISSTHTGPIIAGLNTALLPVLKVFVVRNRSTATTPLNEFAAAVDAARPVPSRRSRV